MDTSNWKPNQGADSSMESVDWRTQFPPDARHKLVNKIMNHLKKQFPFSEQEKLHELKSIALRFEEKIYAAATSHSDYMHKISIKLMAMEKRSNSPQSNPASNLVNPSDSGSQDMQQVSNHGQPPTIHVPSNHPQAGKQNLPQSIHNNVAGQNSSFQNIQNISGVQQNSVGNSMGHGVLPSNFVSQRQVQGNQQQSQNPQHQFYQQQFAQIAKQNLHQNNSTVSHIHQKLLQPSHFQPSQQSVMQPTILQSSNFHVQQNQQSVAPQSGQPVIQHHQQSVLRQQRPHQQQQPRLVGHPNNLSNVQQLQQNSVVQHNNFSALHQHHLGPPQSSSTGQHEQQHQLLGNQHLMQSKVSVPQQNQSTQGQRAQPELQIQSGQLQHPLNMKPVPNLSQREMLQRLPTSGGFQQQQRAMPEVSSTSSDSTAQTGNPNGGDWQEEVYQKIKVMKDKYMPFLKEMYQKFIGRLQQHDSLPQQPKGEQFEKLKKVKQMLEGYMTFLQIPKTNLSPSHKEKLGEYERHIVNIISPHKRKPGATPQQPLTTPHMNSLHQSQQPQTHLTQMQPHENQMNSQMQSVNLRHNNMAILQHNNMCIMQPNSTMLQHQQLKQLHHREMQQQFLHKQQLLHQFHPQTKQQQLNGNEINNGNEKKSRQQIGMKSESLQQNQLSAFHQQLKLGAPFSSAQTDKQNVLNSVTKSGTPLQSANSPFIVSSPSTPSTSHMPIESEKLNSGVSSLSKAGNIGNQATTAMLPTQPFTIGTPGISPSPLLSELTSPDGNHGNDASIISGKSSNIEEPMEHLLKVVKSISARSLSASVSDIGSVVSMIDSIAESAPGNGSRAAVGEDLVNMTKCRLQKTFITQNGTRKSKRLNVVSSSSTVNNSFNCLEGSELESTATSTIKRPRIEINDPLVEEIREINQGLIDTVVDIIFSQEDSAISEVGKGTVVKCSFKAAAFCPNIKSQYDSTQMSPIQPLRLLVPANYPNCSPILLDNLPAEPSKEHKDLSLKAKWRFSSCVRKLSEPTSLDEMARAWDVCVRAVILEHVQQSGGGGGGTFTSKYGHWEDCLTAA